MGRCRSIGGHVTFDDVLNGRREWAVVRGDALASLRAMPDESVQVCVTSPPYYGLRDYGLPPSVWDARPGCRHRWSDEKITTRKQAPQQDSSGGIGKTGTRGEQSWTVGATFEVRSGADCLRCGAWRGCLGLEPTPDLFIAHLVELFREVRRVLRRDGTAWVNLGDSYSGSGKGPTGHNGIGDQGERQGFTDERSAADCWSLKAKDLMMMPARMAIALQEDGWYLRSEITWCKSSAMPESVRDRPTSATERIYLLSKDARYFYDADAVREPHIDPSRGKARTESKSPHSRGDLEIGLAWVPAVREYNPLGANLRNFWTLGPEPSAWDYCNACRRLFVGADRKTIKQRDGQRVCPCGASDWVAHYATYPTAIPRRAIKAGSHAGDIVLDPFSGSATTGRVARQLGRRYIGLELSDRYANASEALLYREARPLLDAAPLPVEQQAALL
jgi:DNA modification methylase